MEIKEIQPARIKRDPTQPRTVFPEDRLKEMAQSIKTEGVINPIEIDENYTIVTGEMRYRASQLAGLKTVPCKIIKIQDTERFMRQVIENIHHNTMTATDTAKAYKRLLRMSPGDTLGGRQPNNKGIAWLSKKLGKSRAVIAEQLQLLEMSKPFQKAVDRGLPYTQLRAINAVPEEHKAKVEKKVLSGEFASRDAAMAVATAVKQNPDLADAILQEDYTDKTYEAVTRKLATAGVEKISDKLDEATKSPKEIGRLVVAMNKWLEKNSLESLGSLFQKDTLLGLTVVRDNIDKWKKGKAIDNPQIIEGTYENHKTTN